MQPGQLRITFIVLHEHMMNGYISALLDLQPVIRVHGIEKIGFQFGKHPFPVAEFRQLVAIYIHRVLTAWPDFLSYCEPDLAEELEALLRESVSRMH